MTTVAMALMDAGALEVVLRCAKCEGTTEFRLRDWADRLVDACPRCGERWADSPQVPEIQRALSDMYEVVRWCERGDDSAPFTIRFGATRRLFHTAA